MKHSLTVSWSIPTPPITPRSSHIWEDKKLEPNPLDKKLSWPAGTHDVLMSALSIGLDRYTEWDTSEASDPSPYKIAAKYFKRGVALKGQDWRMRAGDYKIDILDEQSHKIIGPKIVDHNVAKIWNFDLDDDTLILELNELRKNLDSVSLIVGFLQKQTDPRAVQIIGGGILADTAAFACSIVERPFVLVPTTLLAMVDACVGGKTGVNVGGFGKNQLGQFDFPEAVKVWPSWLESLPDRQVKCGLAECIKHCILSGNSKILEKITSNPTGRINPEDLVKLIEAKSVIVEKDPTETSIRASLNLGHTLAHGLESISHSNNQEIILHGEAVGLGIDFSIDLSRRLGLLDSSSYTYIKQQIKRSGIVPTEDSLKKFLGVTSLTDDSFIDNLYKKIQKDKKNQGDNVNWVLVSSFGKAYRKNDKFTKTVAKSDFISTFLEYLPSLQ